MNEEEIQKKLEGAYLLGANDALELYAWWKDGEQFVGSCGTTLKQARETLENDLESLFLCKKKVFEKISGKVTK